jgi:hypothetical protein
MSLSEAEPDNATPLQLYASYPFSSDEEYQVRLDLLGNKQPIPMIAAAH